MASISSTVTFLSSFAGVSLSIVYIITSRGESSLTSAHVNRLYQSSEDSTTEAFENSADAEAAKRAARWAAMASGATVEGAAVEGATEKGGITEEVAAEGTEGAKDVAVEEGVVGVTENADGVEDTTADATDTTESKPDPNDEWWCEALDVHKELGCRYIVMSRLPDYPTEEVVAEYATYFNRIGELAAERGMQFCYHPRQQELKVTDGKSIFEVIVANTDPEKVHFEIDTYEAVEAGVDVNELLKRLTKRVTLLHIHDYGIIGESQKIDFEKIIAEGIRTGVKDIFVEVRNFSLPPMNCIERSIYNVESLPSISY